MDTTDIKDTSEITDEEYQQALQDKWDDINDLYNYDYSSSRRGYYVPPHKPERPQTQTQTHTESTCPNWNGIDYKDIKDFKQNYELLAKSAIIKMLNAQVQDFNYNNGTFFATYYPVELRFNFKKGSVYGTRAWKTNYDVLHSALKQFNEVIYSSLYNYYCVDFGEFVARARTEFIRKNYTRYYNTEYNKVVEMFVGLAQGFEVVASKTSDQRELAIQVLAEMKPAIELASNLAEFKKKYTQKVGEFTATSRDDMIKLAKKISTKPGDEFE